MKFSCFKKKREERRKEGAGQIEMGCKYKIYWIYKVLVQRK